MISMWQLDVGHRVRHRKLGLGSVIAANGSEITVEYDEPYETAKGGWVKHRGVYNADWFRINPTLLEYIRKDKP